MIDAVHQIPLLFFIDLPGPPTYPQYEQIYVVFPSPPIFLVGKNMHTYTIGMITCMVSSRINLPSI
jgi:hypothetical protein